LASGSFEKTNLNWQLQQLSQQVGEWFEHFLAQQNLGRFNPQVPTIPDWLLRTLFWLMVAVAIAWATWQLYQVLKPYLENYWRLQSSASLQVMRPVASVSVADWLQQARSAQQQGDYRTACRSLYMAAIQRLSDRGVIPDLVSRTDGEYLYLLRDLNLPAAYQVLIGTHERLYFDQVTASAENYDRCWQAYQEIESP
jgi:Domain of unknown function (DUF4129)